MQESIEERKAHQQQLAAGATEEQPVEEKNKNQARLDDQAAPKAGCCNIL